MTPTKDVMTETDARDHHERLDAKREILALDSLTEQW